jgi:hypothetical protein
LDIPADIEPLNIQEAKNTESQKREYNKKNHEIIPEFQRITCSKTAAESNEIQIPWGNHGNEYNQEAGKPMSFGSKHSINIAPFLRPLSPVKNLIKTEEAENATSEIEKRDKLFTVNPNNEAFFV